MSELTNEQINLIQEKLGTIASGSQDIKNVLAMPSNNGVTENTNPENGEYKMMNVLIDPLTGENKVIGNTDTENKEYKFSESFEKLCENVTDKVNDSNFYQIEYNELSEYMKSSESDNDELLKILMDDSGEIDHLTMMQLLDVVNKKINNEDFNVYKALPEKIQNYIKTLATENGELMDNSNEAKQLRNALAEAIIGEFIIGISADKVKTDLNKEIEEIYKVGTGEIVDSIVGYTEERNNKYREYLNTLEDEETKRRMTEILDTIDEAYNLSKLKEFCKKFKVKKIELERCDKKSYNIDFLLRKYDNSEYDIYSIYLAEPILYRAINELYPDQYTMKDIRAFFLAFCSQCSNHDPNNVLEHAYVYYVIYNIVLIDINKGEKKNVSNKYIENIIECINNIRTRNSIMQ